MDRLSLLLPRASPQRRGGLWLAGGWALTPSVALAATGAGGGLGAGSWVAVGLVVAGGTAAWFAGRRDGRQLAQKAGHLSSLLEFADCLLWQGTVTLDGASWAWEFKVQPTGLARRIFAGAKPPEIGGLWRQFNLVEQAEMNRRCREALENNRPGYEQEFHFVKDGKTTWLRESVSITRLGPNRFSLVGLVTDITQQRELEMARRATEERLRQLLSRADCLLWQARVSQLENGGTHWEWFIPDSELFRRVGGTRDPAPRMPWATTLVPEFDEINGRAAAALKGGLPGYEQEFRVVLHNTVLWLHEQVSIETIAPGEWRLEGVIVDITAQREAEESKRASEEQLQRVMQTADFMLWHARVFRTATGDLRWVLNVPGSTLYRRVFGVEPTEPELMHWEEVVSRETFEAMVQCANGALEHGEAGYEQEVEARRGGEVFWLHEQATVRQLAAGEWQVVGIVTDVTTRHLAEEARQGSERALREILERANCLLWRATVMRRGDDVEWTTFDLPASRLFRELRGGRPSGEADRLWDYADVPELVEMNARSAQAMLSGAPEYEQEFRATVGGKVFWLHEQVTIAAIGQQGWRLVGVITDVTQRHEAVEAQRKSEVRLQELLERADCLIWHGRVTRRGDGAIDWNLWVPRSRLHRRIFGCDPTPGPLQWPELGVPELPEMTDRARNALTSGAPGYEQVFHIPKPEGDIWVTEQVTIAPTGPDEWECMGVITDITARREAERARRETEAQLQQILELADCMVWEATVVERATGELDWSLYTPRSMLYRRLFGDDEQKATLSWRKLDVPEIVEIEQRSREAVRGRAPGYEQEFRVVQLQRVVWLREVVTISPIAPDKFRLVGVITDITAQREAQEAHRASLAQVEQMLGGAECMLWQARVFEVAPGRLRWVMFIPRSRLYRELFGRDPGVPPTIVWPEVLEAATEQEINARAAAAIFSGESSYEQEFRAQRGERVFWLHERASITLVGTGEWKVVGVMTDLTARREAEQSLRGSELRYRTLYQHTPIPIVEADFAEVDRWLTTARAQGITDLAAWLDLEPKRLVHGASLVRIIDCNAAAMAMLRARSKADFRRRRGVLASRDSMGVVRDIMLAIWRGGNRLEAEIDMYDFEGQAHRVSLRWWMERGGETGEHRPSVIALVDLSDLKRAEAALASEKERLAVTLRAMAEGVIMTDVQGNVQFMNEAAALFTGHEAQESIGLPVGEICLFENDRTGERVEVPVARVAQGDVVVDLPSRTRMSGRGGVSRLVEGCCAPIHSAASAVIGTVLVFRDVTEHERLEQELVRATKLESVGILAGGIAHDFNNILTAVMGNVALAALDVAADSEAGRCLAEAEKATLRARDLTQQLLTFAKGGEPVRTAVRLDAVVREIATFTLHGSKVKAQFEVPDDLWAADADKGQIGRVVQNLVLNAVQAMPDGGTVRIALGNEHADGLARLSLAPGDYVKIEISDTGIGIKPEHLPRIFDPYFTTKQMGSGLGLAAVYSIVKKHRGTIDVESLLGLGTTFRIWLPASHEPTNGSGGVVRQPQTLSLKGRVLFMDDEEAIRQMATFLLRRFGFEVECAVDGAEAVEKFRAAQGERRPFALVIMDLTVPGGMGGKEAISRLRELDPKVKAIVSSGYSSDPVLANYREHGFCGVATKPYEVSDLARVLRDALAG